MNEQIFLLQLTDTLYKKPFNKLYKIAKENNLLFYISSVINDNYLQLIPNEEKKRIRTMTKRGKRIINKIINSISIIEKRNDYILVKTYRGYPRLAHDLDLLVKNLTNWSDYLKRSNLKSFNYDKHLNEICFSNSITAKIHLHTKMNWVNKSYFDDDLIWYKPRKVSYLGKSVIIPNYTADFLIHIAHINYEPMHFTLSELLYIFNISSKVKWSIALNQSKKYHWFKTFINTLNIFNIFHWYYFNSPAPFNKIILEKKVIAKNISYQLPRSFPRTHIIKAFFEKGIYFEPLKKINKVAKVLLSGNSRSGFYQAPEDELILGINY